MLHGNGGGGAEGMVMDIVEKAENMLADQRHSDALQAARFARREASQYIAARNSASRELAPRRAGIAAIEAIGADVGEAREILEQARKHRVEAAATSWRRSPERASRGSGQGRGEHPIRAFAHRAGAGRPRPQGQGFSGGPKAARDALLDDLKAHRYSSAKKGLDLYRENLEELSDIRNACVSSLSKLTEGMVRLPASPYRADVEELMTRAQKAFGSGSFREALALSEECRSAGNSGLKRHEMAAARLEEVRSSLLEGEGRKAMVPEVADLLASAGKALSNGRYESMDALLLRARGCMPSRVR